MIMMIIGASELFAYTLSSLFVTQSIAMWIADLDVNRWVLMAFINVFLLVAGFFLPPVAVILMTAPILLPIITQAGFDPYWFAVILTINMEIGLITPPVGLNLYVINGIAPDVPLPTILKGALPYVLCMVLGIVILCCSRASPPGCRPTSWDRHFDDPCDPRPPASQRKLQMSDDLFHALEAAVPDPEKTLLELADGGHVSYGEAFRLSARLANVLEANGVEPGDRVAVQVEKPWQVDRPLSRDLPRRRGLPAAQHRLHAHRDRLLPRRRRAQAVRLPAGEPRRPAAGGRRRRRRGGR